MKTYRFETHFHTDESSPCGTIPAAESVGLYREKGYDGIVVTDHFSASVQGEKGSVSWEKAVDDFLLGYQLAKAEGEKQGLTVLLGAELRFPGNYNDLLVYGMTEAFLRREEWLYERTLEAFYPLADRMGFVIVQAHPFRPECRRENPAFLHGIEVFNGNPRHHSHNGLAKDWAQRHGLLESAGSDFHKYEDLAGAAVLLETLPQDSPAFADALRRGAFAMEIRRTVEP